eukprot:12500713-Alexandrium_andersonii.AAC.1
MRQPSGHAGLLSGWSMRGISRANTAEGSFEGLQSWWQGGSDAPLLPSPHRDGKGKMVPCWSRGTSHKGGTINRSELERALVPQQEHTLIF